MRFDKYLTPEERLEAWSRGITFKLAENEVLPSEFDAMCKKAFSTQGAVKSLLWTSLLMGAPIGIAAHLISNQVNSSSKKSRELRKKREYYRDLAQKLKDAIEEEDTLGNTGDTP